jgi:hypothetical protein
VENPTFPTNGTRPVDLVGLTDVGLAQKAVIKPDIWPSENRHFEGGQGDSALRFSQYSELPAAPRLDDREKRATHLGG